MQSDCEELRRQVLEQSRNIEGDVSRDEQIDEEVASNEMNKLDKTEVVVRATLSDWRLKDQQVSDLTKRIEVTHYTLFNGKLTVCIYIVYLFKVTIELVTF